MSDRSQGRGVVENPRASKDERSPSFWRRLPRPIIGLAPMDGVTDAAFRRIVTRCGKPDVMFTEFTSVGDICYGPDHRLRSLLYHERERPIIAQLYGKDPAQFYRAAHAVCELGFDGVDINMGCPSKNVAASGAGAGLIRTPELAHRILEASTRGIEDWMAGQGLQDIGFSSARIEVFRSMNRRRSEWDRPPYQRAVPLSVKTRLGYDSDIIEEWVDSLMRARPEVISIHGRTLSQMYRGEANWTAIAKAADRIRGSGCLVLGNGDCASMAEVAVRVMQSGVHGVLLGRATLGHPWLFRTKESARLACSQAAPHLATDPRVGLEERLQVMLDHARLFEAINGSAGFPGMRKHLGWYCHGFPYAASLRARMFRTASSRDVEQLVEALWPDLSIDATSVSAAQIGLDACLR